MSKVERTIFSGAEWPLREPHWLVLQLSEGAAYLRGGQVSRELPVGSLVVVPPDSAVNVLASVLGNARLRGFSFKVGSLSGLLTSSERSCLQTDAARECAPYRVLPPSHPLGSRITGLFEKGWSLTLASRLGLMLDFAEWLSPVLARTERQRIDPAERNPKARLNRFLNETPETELVGLSLGEVARHLNCCERHANRLFHQVCGRGFRNYISELRLDRACQMLMHPDYKIVDVALESGHSSLALFNYTFKNRFRMTPTEWRERHLPRERRPARTGAPMAA
jgi:AraC-like DNA-binding protein